MADIVIRVVVDPGPAVQGSAQVGTALDGVRAKAQQTTDDMGRLAKAFIAQRVLRELEQLADGFTDVQNRIRTVTSSEEEMVRVSNQLFEVAQQTRTSWSDTAATFQRVEQATRELGLSQQQVIDFTKQLNEAFIIAGVSAGEQSRVTRDLLHGLDQGTLAWRQLLPIMSQAPSVARIIAEHFHVTTGELHGLATAGKITGREIIAAFSEASSSLDAGFGKTVPTIAQGMVMLRNAAEKFLGELMHGSIVVGVLGAGMKLLIDNFDTVGKALVVLADVLIAKWAYTAIPAAITATRAFTAALLANPLFLGIAIVSAIYLFRDAIIGAFKSVLEFVEGLPILGQALWLVEHALSAIADVAGWVGDKLSALGGIISDVGSAVGDFLSLGGPLVEQLEADRRATILLSIEMMKLGLSINQTTRLAQAFTAVNIVQKTNDIIAAIGLVVALQHEIQIAQVAAAKVFGADLVEATHKAAKAAEDAKRAAEEWARATAAMTTEINRMRAEISPTVTAAQQLAEVIDKVTAAERRHILSAAEGTALIQARTVAIAAQQIAADQMIDRQSASVADLLAADERRLALARELAQQAPGQRVGPIAPQVGKIDELQAKLDQLAHTADTTLVNAFDHVAQALAELVTTGKFNWRSLTDSILADLTKMIARMLEMKLLAFAIGLIGGSSSGAATGAIDYFASQAAGTPVYGGAHAMGGSFTAPGGVGGGGVDSVPVLFRMSPGETATFDGGHSQQAAAAAPAPVNISNQVIIDPGFVPSQMSSPAGHRAMMEFIRLNARQVAQLTNG